MTTLRTGETYRLAQLLPHGPGMLLLDRLVGYEADALTCELTIRADSPFCDGRAVPAWAGIEYMAQALGAYTGITRLQRGRPVQVLMLLGTRNYDCRVPAFPVGCTLSVRVQLAFWDPDGVCAFDCELRDGDALLATSQVKGYTPDDIEPLLGQLEGAHA